MVLERTIYEKIFVSEQYTSDNFTSTDRRHKLFNMPNTKKSPLLSEDLYFNILNTLLC